MTIPNTRSLDHSTYGVMMNGAIPRFYLSTSSVFFCWWLFHPTSTNYPHWCLVNLFCLELVVFFPSISSRKVINDSENWVLVWQKKTRPLVGENRRLNFSHFVVFHDVWWSIKKTPSSKTCIYVSERFFLDIFASEDLGKMMKNLWRIIFVSCWVVEKINTTRWLFFFGGFLRLPNGSIRGKREVVSF